MKLFDCSILFLFQLVTVCPGTYQPNSYERWGFVRYLFDQLELSTNVCHDKIESCKTKKSKFWENFSFLDATLAKELKKVCPTNLPMISPVHENSSDVAMQKIRAVLDLIKASLFREVWK